MDDVFAADRVADEIRARFDVMCEQVNLRYALKAEVDAGRNPKDAKVMLAKEITARFHNAVAGVNDGWKRELDIVGIGSSPSNGLRKGVVINIDSTVASIRKAVEEAELMAGCEIKSVYAGIAGGHIKGLNSQGIIAIKNREVSPEDRAALIALLEDLLFKTRRS